MTHTTDPRFKHAVVNMLRAYRDGQETMADSFFEGVEMNNLKREIKAAIIKTIKESHNFNCPAYIWLEGISSMVEETRAAWLRRSRLFYLSNLLKESPYQVSAVDPVDRRHSAGKKTKKMTVLEELLKEERRRDRKRKHRKRSPSPTYSFTPPDGPAPSSPSSSEVDTLRAEVRRLRAENSFIQLVIKDWNRLVKNRDQLLEERNQLYLLLAIEAITRLQNLVHPSPPPQQNVVQNNGENHDNRPGDREHNEEELEEGEIRD